MNMATLRRRITRSGFALLIVLIMIVLLGVIVMAFVRDVFREVSISANVRDDLKSAYLAQMALVRGQVILRLDDHADYDSLNEPWAQPLSWEGETWGADTSGEESGGTGMTQPDVRITDEERKFNLLMLVRGNETQQQKARATLERLIGICRREDDRLMLDGEARSARRGREDSMNTEQLVTNLVKYLEERASEDSDDLDFTANAGSKPDVRSMKKQTPFEMLTLGELLQIEGWSESLLYGPVRRADESLVAKSDGEAEPARDWRDLTDQEKFEQRRQAIENVDQRSSDPNPLPLLGFLTLYSTGYINVNTAPREILLALDERMTWDVVEKILTAREADRQDVVAAEENGGALPEEEPDPSLEGETAEEEDKASFRPTDLATYTAFITRVSNPTPPADGEPPAEPTEIEGFDEEIYNAIRPWLVVVSTVFEVEASALSGKIRHSIRAVYRRAGSNEAPANQPPADAAAPAADSANTDDPLPPEPQITLTLLSRDVNVGG